MSFEGLLLPLPTDTTKTATSLNQNVGQVGGFHGGLSIIGSRSIAIPPPQRHASAAALSIARATPGGDASRAVEVVGMVGRC